MPTYTVHEPQPPAETIDDRATGLVFVKEGFAWWAFIAPFLWLLYNRLWRDLILFLLISAALMAAVRAAGGNSTALAWAGLPINFAFGFEARNFYRATLARRGYALIAVVTGRDLADAERRFLSEWLPGAQAKTASAGPAPEAPKAGGAMPFMGIGVAHG